MRDDATKSKGNKCVYIPTYLGNTVMEHWVCLPLLVSRDDRHIVGAEGAGDNVKRGAFPSSNEYRNANLGGITGNV
jgi:hypothetical protein